jgi:hypothetical protein
MAYIVHTAQSVESYIQGIEGLSVEGKRQVFEGYLQDLAERAEHFLERYPLRSCPALRRVSPAAAWPRTWSAASWPAASPPTLCRRTITRENACDASNAVIASPHTLAPTKPFLTCSRNPLMRTDTPSTKDDLLDAVDAAWQQSAPRQLEDFLPGLAKPKDCQAVVT